MLVFQLQQLNRAQGFNDLLCVAHVPDLTVLVQNQELAREVVHLIVQLRCLHLFIVELGARLPVLVIIVGKRQEEERERTQKRCERRPSDLVVHTG